LSIRTIDTRVKAFLIALLLAFSVENAHAAGIPAKVKKALEATSPKVRIAAVVAISKSKAPEARELLEAMLADKETTVRAAAIEGLGTLGDPAALPAITRAAKETDSTVASAAKSTMMLLESRRTRVDLSDVGDLSGKNYKGLSELLEKGVAETVAKQGGPSYVLVKDQNGKGYGLGLKVRTIKQKSQPGANLVEVKCDMTIVELPSKALRLASSATSAAGIEGPISPRMEEELSRDAVAACAPALAKDFLDYMTMRR
jgi:hypothetical protein